ncbi:MAG: NADPH:quinone oxidoreductase family protein [Sulfuricaulis sp.]|nr:NADPH:quinone oxidoreductase family protein [Sulfuricaulis sp.]
MVLMKSWRAEAFGKPRDVLRLREIELPQPPQKCVAVRVSAVGVGLPDLFMTQGIYPLVKAPPVSPGQEVVGEVVAAGAGAQFSVGDRVMGLTQYAQGWGGYSQYCLMADHRVCLAPACLSDEEAAGFCIPFRTAHAALVTRTALKPGETLLVLGAAGSSGSAAIQLGKSMGATVIAVASSTEKLEFCERIGAQHLINYKDKAGDFVEAVKRLTGGRGVDVIFDPVGGETCERAAHCLARYGRIGLVGFASGSWPRLDPLDMVLKNYSALGVFAGGLALAEEGQTFVDLCALAEQGKIKTPIARVFAFDEVLSALKLLETSPPPGKMIIKVKG